MLQVGQELKNKVTSIQNNARTIAWLLRERPAGGAAARKRRCIDRAVESITLGRVMMGSRENKGR